MRVCVCSFAEFSENTVDLTCYSPFLPLSPPFSLHLCTTLSFPPSQVGNMSSVLERVNGVARCPYDPRHNSTAVVTESGELYAATVIDFSGRDPVIYRSLGGMPPLRTAQYNSKWLNGTVAQQQVPHMITLTLKSSFIRLFVCFFLCCS